MTDYSETYRHVTDRAEEIARRYDLALGSDYTDEDVAAILDEAARDLADGTGLDLEAARDALEDVRDAYRANRSAATWDALERAEAEIVRRYGIDHETTDDALDDICERIVTMSVDALDEDTVARWLRETRDLIRADRAYDIAETARALAADWDRDADDDTIAEYAIDLDIALRRAGVRDLDDDEAVAAVRAALACHARRTHP